MSVVYNNSVKDDRLQVVVDALDATTDPAILVIGTSSLSGATGVLAQITLDTPSAVVASQVLTLSTLPREAVASAGGTAAKAELRDGDDVTIVSGLTVGTVATDVIINSVTITNGQTVRCTAGTITHG